MLLIHPGFPKTGTTYLQHLVRHEEWYVGAEKTDAASTHLSSAARGVSSVHALSEAVGNIAERAAKGGPVLMSEEAILSLRPYEIAFKIGLYRRIGAQEVKDSGLHEPAHKLVQIAGAVQGTERAWLLTVRRHRDWCRSYYRYTLSELGPHRAGVYLQALAAAQTIGGPLYAPTIRLIRALDPEAPLVVVPMEAIIAPAHQAEVTRLFAERFGLDMPLAASGVSVNASTTPLPSAYMRFVSGMTHLPLPGPLRQVGRTAEGMLRARLAGMARSDTTPFDSGIAQMADTFRQDVACLQSHCPFDLQAFGYVA
jgi:hypothetical protein